MARNLSENGDIVNALYSATSALGIKLEDYCLNLGLPKALLHSPEQFSSSHLYGYLLDSIATEFHCHDLSLHIAEALHAPRLGFPANLLSYSSTFHDGLDEANRYKIFYHDIGHWHWHPVGEQVSLQKRCEEAAKCFHQRNLFGTAQMFLHLQLLANNLWRPSKVYFSFESPNGLILDKFHRFFNCELVFKHEFDAVAFDRKYLSFSIANSDPTKLRYALQQLNAMQQALFKNKTFLERTAILMAQRLRFSDCTAQNIAEDMELSIEEFSNQLAVNACSFKELHEQQLLQRLHTYVVDWKVPPELAANALLPKNKSLQTILLGKLSAQSKSD